ncbi:MAG: CopG family transcriptional regulator [Burkholderiales bacterium]
MPFVLLEPAIGEKEGQFTSKNITYTDEPIGKIRTVKDLFPSPEQLVMREDTVKETLSLTHKSLEFFKEQAKKQDCPYQQMICSLN